MKPKCCRCREPLDVPREGLHRAVCAHCGEVVGVKNVLRSLARNLQISAFTALLMGIVSVVFAVVMMVKSGYAVVDHTYVDERSWKSFYVSSTSLADLVTLVLGLMLMLGGILAMCRPHHRLLLPLGLLQLLQAIRFIIPSVLGILMVSAAQSSFTATPERLKEFVGAMLTCTIVLVIGGSLALNTRRQYRAIQRDPDVSAEDKSPLLRCYQHDSGITGPPVHDPAESFGNWYATRIGRWHMAVQITAWFLYGFIWIPAWYSCGHGAFGSWYRSKLGRMPIAAQIILWTMWGFIWIPVWYLATRR